MIRTVFIVVVVAAVIAFIITKLFTLGVKRFTSKLLVYAAAIVMIIGGSILVLYGTEYDVSVPVVIGLFLGLGAALFWFHGTEI